MVKKRVTVFIDEDLWKKFKDIVYKKTGSFKAASGQLEKIIREWLEKNR